MVVSGHLAVVSESTNLFDMRGDLVWLWTKTNLQCFPWFWSTHISCPIDFVLLVFVGTIYKVYPYDWYIMLCACRIVWAASARLLVCVYTVIRYGKRTPVHQCHCKRTMFNHKGWASLGQMRCFTFVCAKAVKVICYRFGAIGIHIPKQWASMHWVFCGL